MIFEKWIKFGIVLVIIVFVIGHLGCERTQSLLMPADTIVPLSPEMSQTLMGNNWRVTSIDGTAISDSVLQMQTLVTKYVSEDINISFGTVINPDFRLNTDGTWKLSVYYYLLCDRNSEQSSLVPVDPIENSSLVFVDENSSLVFVDLSVSGTYLAGFDTEKQAHVLIFETEKHTRGTISHTNPYSEVYICLFESDCPSSIIYPAFTADLDWSIFDEAPLSKLFSSPLFDTQSGTPAVYTWDMVTSEGTPEDYWSERGYGVSDDIVLGPLVRYTLRLYSQGQEDIVLRRTEKE